jgi:hypothetical protein
VSASITVRVPLTVRRRPGRKTIVTPDGQAHAPTRVRSDPALVKALARAFRWQRLLDEGRYGSISEMARAERIERGFLGRVLRLALLAPDLVEAVLNGTQGSGLSLPALLDGVPVIWGEQSHARTETELSRPLTEGTENGWNWPKPDWQLGGRKQRLAAAPPQYMCKSSFGSKAQGGDRRNPHSRLSPQILISMACQARGVRLLSLRAEACRTQRDATKK